MAEPIATTTRWRPVAGPTFALLFARWRDWVPAAALIVFARYVAYAAIREFISDPQASHLLGYLPFIFDGMFAVAWHRAVLCERAGSIMRDLRISRAVFLYWLVLVLFEMPPVIASLLPSPSLGSAIALIALMVPLAVAMARVSLILPAISLERALSVREAWNLSRGVGWRILIATLGVVFVSSIPLMFVSLADGPPDDGAPYALYRLLLYATSVAVAASGVTVLSLTYKRLGGPLA